MVLVEDSIAIPDVAEDLPTLYEATFPAVAGFVARLGGSLEDARDVFHDALILFLEKSDRARIVTSREAYIVGIAKHIWLRQRRRGFHLLHLDDFESRLSLPEAEELPITEKLFRALEHSGQACLELLQAVYYEKLALPMIAVRLGFSSAHSVSVQKHKCLTKIRNIIQAKSLQHDDFTE